MRAALKSLANAGCCRVYLAGSFVTAKAEPGDWDACWDPADATFMRLDKALLTEDPGMMNMLYGGEAYKTTSLTKTGATFLLFFQRHRDGYPVGLVAPDPATAK